MDQGLSSTRMRVAPAAPIRCTAAAITRGMRIVRIFQREMSQPICRRARQVDFDGDGLAFDQPPQAAQLVEHLLHGGQQLAGFVGPAARH